MEKISANKLTRSIVKPNSHAVKTVEVNTIGIITATTTAALQPRKNQTKAVTIEVAINNLKIRWLTLALAEAP